MNDGSQPGPGYVVADRYQLEERLGRGGMSTVWRATDLVLHREVAVKVVAEMEDAETTAERFRREARATAALNHPNIVSVFDAGVDHERAFLVMELLPGRTLADELRSRGAFPVGEVRDIAVQVAGALHAAHEAGLVHRDIKPGNIARTAEGGVKVLDFGITHIIDKGVAGGHHPLTATGAVIGTAAYLAPEQARGERVDQRADLYSLGCVLYTLLTGKPPFQGPTAVSTMMLHATEPVPDLADVRPDVPQEMAAVVHALLQKNPEARPQTAADVGHAMQADTAEQVTRYLPPPIVGEETTVVPAGTVPAPSRAYPADAPGPEVGAPAVPARAAVDPPDEEPEDEPTGLFTMDEVEDPDRTRLVIAMIVVALFLVGIVGWWLLTRDAELTANPSPTAAVPGSPSPTPTPTTTPTEPPTASAEPTRLFSHPPVDPLGSATPLDEPTLIDLPVEQPEPAAVPTTQGPAQTTQAPPPPATQAPPPPATQAPPPRTTQAPPPAANAEDAAAAVESAADRLSGAVQDAMTGGTLDNRYRKDVDAGLRDLSKALRNNDDQQASDALSRVDQALSDSGQKDRFDGLYTRLKDAVDRWKTTL